VKGMLTDLEMKLAKELANVYLLMDKNPKEIDLYTKEFLYQDAGKNPQIHHEALKIRNKLLRLG